MDILQKAVSSASKMPTGVQLMPRLKQEVVEEEEVEDVRVRWSPDFKSTYQRNRNSRTKTKNLRCFPGCLNGKHEQFGFCGGVVTASVAPGSQLYSRLVPPSSVQAFAKFTLYDADNSSSSRAVEPVVPPNPDQVRSPRFPRKPWIPVELTWSGGSSSSMDFVINPELVGWHYDWKSSRKNRELQHCLRLYIWLGSGVNKRELLHVTKSRPFVLYSGNQNPLDRPEASRKRKFSPAGLSVKVEPGLGRAEKRFHDSTAKKNSKDSDSSMTLRNLVLKAKNQLEDARRRRLGEQKGLSDSIVFDEHEASKFLDELLQSTDESILRLSSFELEPDSSSKPDEVLDGAMIQEIVNIISSDDLIKDISQFLNACTTGPLGAALCDVLDSLNSLEGMNPFVKEFSKSIFLRFQNIVSQKLQRDLSTKTLLSFKNGANASAAAVNPDMSNGGLLYDVNDDNKIYEFLKLIRSWSRSPNIRQRIMQEKKLNKHTRFDGINRIWNARDPADEKWWLEVGCEELGIMDELQAKYLGKMYRSLAIYVEPNLFSWQGDEGFGNVVVNLIPDGKVHDMDKISFLMDYVELSRKKYIAYHLTSVEGDYFMDYAMWFRRKGEDGLKQFCYFYGCFKTKTNSGALEITQKVLITEQPLPPELILPNCRSLNPQYMVGQPAHFRYTAV